MTRETAFGMCFYDGLHGEAQWWDDESLDECVARLMGVPVEEVRGAPTDGADDRS